MSPDRERKAEPHACSCGAHFEVGYFDDRQGDRAALPNELADVACPACGKAKSLSLPAGAAKTVVVERTEDVVGHEEGVGD